MRGPCGRWLAAAVVAAAAGCTLGGGAGEIEIGAPLAAQPDPPLVVVVRDHPPERVAVAIELRDGHGGRRVVPLPDDLAAERIVDVAWAPDGRTLVFTAELEERRGSC